MKIEDLNDENNFDENDLDEFEDETLVERLWGLTEMFPEPVRNITGVVVDKTAGASKSIYQVTRAGMWIAASSFLILLLPVILENERSHAEQQQLNQQRELLLGTSAAVSSGGSASLPDNSFGFGYSPAQK